MWHVRKMNSIDLQYCTCKSDFVWYSFADRIKFKQQKFGHAVATEKYLSKVVRFDRFYMFTPEFAAMEIKLQKIVYLEHLFKPRMFSFHSFESLEDHLTKRYRLLDVRVLIFLHTKTHNRIIDMCKSNV